MEEYGNERNSNEIHVKILNEVTSLVSWLFIGDNLLSCDVCLVFCLFYFVICCLHHSTCCV